MRSDFQFDYWGIFAAGQNAAKAGQKGVSNPHHPHSAEFKAWADGYARPDFEINPNLKRG